MLRISTTTVEQWRRIQDGEFGSEEELIASIKGKPFEARWQMDAGKAWHALLADPAIDVSRVPPCTDNERHACLGYEPDEGNTSYTLLRELLANVRPLTCGNYTFSENAVALGRERICAGPGSVWEVKGTKTLQVLGQTVTLVAQADHWRGLELDDAKATWSNPSLDAYEASFQWRAYLLVHAADKFSYHRFAFREPKGSANVCELREALSCSFWRYAELEADVVATLTDFVAWAQHKGLLTHLQRESSTPVFEEAA